MNVTYIPMARGFVYLAAVVDWFSRRVLSWRMSITMEASFCVETLEKALTKHGKPEIFNTDQGASLQESCSRMFCDEALVKAGVNELVLVASEAGGRVRLAHVENNDTETCKLFAAGQVRHRRARRDRRTRRLQQEEPRQAPPRRGRANQGRAARERRRARLPLDDLAVEALAARHPRWRGA